MPTNSDDDKGSSTNLSSVVGSTPLKTKPNTPTKSPLKPQASTDQEKTEPEKVDELESRIPELSKPTETAIVPVFDPIPQYPPILVIHSLINHQCYLKLWKNL